MEERDVQPVDSPIVLIEVSVVVVLVGAVLGVEQRLRGAIEDQADGHASAPDHRQVGQVAVLRLLVILQTAPRL